MVNDSRVQTLLDARFDAQLTPEEVCSDCPELLPAVRREWRRMRVLDAQLDALFPKSSGATQDQACAEAELELPSIDDHVIEQVLQRGGMGIIYEARHLRLNRRVAVKMPLPGAALHPVERERFLREAEAVAKLRHANIVQIYATGDYCGRPYFTMEYLDGGTLAQSLAGAPQPARSAAALVATLADAVEAAHRSGIVHRDLKPANILLTAEGVPKVADFGLARYLDSTATLTNTGCPIGTPSYMAPEQAQGHASAIGPATDIYSLGAILYELLTGRPPFLAESAADTVVQLLSREPVPPSRLNAKTPRDLETICLKCLRKDPMLRYASAAELKDDVERFLSGRPILARRFGWGRRAWRWSRRNPSSAALIALAVGLTSLSAASGWSLRKQALERRAERAGVERDARTAIEASLQVAEDLSGRGRWSEAAATLDGAQRSASAAAPAALLQRLGRAAADAKIVMDLEDIRLELSRTSSESDPRDPEQMYASAFSVYGIDLLKLEPEIVAAHLRESAVRQTLVEFLHDWLYWASPTNRARISASLDLADEDTWRRTFRAAIAVKEDDPSKMKALAIMPEALEQPPVIVSGICGALLTHNHRPEALALLTNTQTRRPEDFWINFLLGTYWDQERPQQAVGYLRAAIAVRPTSDQAYNLLARVLRRAGDPEGGLTALQNVVALNPNPSNLKELAKLLAPKGRLNEVHDDWKKHLRNHGPTNHESWYGFPQLCLFLGDEDGYGWSRASMLEHVKNSGDAWQVPERMSQACLLLPPLADQSDKVAAVIALTEEIGPDSQHPDHRYVQFVQGLAAYRAGDFTRAIALLQPAADKLPSRPGPRLILAMAQFKVGRADEARRLLADAILAYDWRAAKADHTTAWGSHVFRREAERLILPNLSALVAGNDQPRDANERRAILGECQFQDRGLATAQIFNEAFAADPKLPNDFVKGCRLRAAFAAARVGCGQSPDTADLATDERTKWRAQALAWLQADLGAWEEVASEDLESAREGARRWLEQVQSDTDLAGLRDRVDLEKLDAPERTQFLRFWDQVELLRGRVK